MPGEENIVAPSKVIHAAKVSARRLVVEDRVRVPQPGEPAALEHANTVVSLLALMNQCFSIAAHVQEQLPPEGMGRAHERIGDPDTLARGRPLPEAIVLEG